jgi:hypothetical protein
MTENIESYYGPFFADGRQTRISVLVAGTKITSFISLTWESLAVKMVFKEELEKRIKRIMKATSSAASRRAADLHQTRRSHSVLSSRSKTLQPR